MMTIKFITWDEETDGIAVEHNGTEVWADGSHDSWDQYFRHHMPKGRPVLLSQDTRPSEHDDRPYPQGESTDVRLARWLVDNNDNPDVRLDTEDEDDGPVTISKTELGYLLYSVAERMYWHGVDDVRERHGR